MRQTKLTKKQKEAIEDLIKEQLISDSCSDQVHPFFIHNLCNAFPKLTKKLLKQRNKFLKAEEKYEQERYGKDCNCDVEKDLHI